MNFNNLCICFKVFNMQSVEQYLCFSKYCLGLLAELYLKFSLSLLEDLFQEHRWISKPENAQVPYIKCCSTFYTLCRPQPSPQFVSVDSTNTGLKFHLQLVESIVWNLQIQKAMYHTCWKIWVCFYFSIYCLFLISSFNFDESSICFFSTFSSVDLVISNCVVFSDFSISQYTSKLRTAVFKNILPLS